MFKQIIIIVQIIKIYFCCNILFEGKNLYEHTSKILSLNYTKCIEEALNYENYEIIDKYLDILSQNKINFTQTFTQIMSSRLKQIQKIKKLFLDNSHKEKFEPCIYWSQNNLYIFMEIQYKNECNGTIICNDLENENLELLTDSNYVHFEGYCYDKVNKINIKFEKEMYLFGNLNKLKSLYNSKSNKKNGKYYATLNKKENGIWETLFKKKDKNNDNPNIIKTEGLEWEKNMNESIIQFN